MSQNIVLIGFMGSGKTSVGRKLSDKLGRIMEDTDKLIEEREGRTINDIFARNGEGYFREKETELLKEISQSFNNMIVSVGGGTPLREENRILLKQIGIVVYLRVRPKTVYKRLKGDTTRPLLQGNDPLQRITELLSQRSTIYEESADIILDVDELNIEQVIEQMLEQINETCERKL